MVRAEAVYTEYENKKMNRYIGYQVLALNKARHNPEAFWKLVEHIMRSSDAFQILALNHCWPQWQRHKKWNDVLDAVEEYRGIVAKPDRISFHRKYIEKGGGKG